jgi:hypothetical protein
VAGGAATARLTGDERRRRVAEWATLGVFLGTSVSLYCNAPWTNWLARACRAESGRDWMLNSGITHFAHERPRPAVHLLAAGLFATYPLWFRLGVRLGRRAGASRSSGAHAEAPAGR